MRAAVLKGIGVPLVIETVPDPLPGDGEAIVRLAAAALNHRDVWIRKGQYAGLKFPIILGSDGVGEVVEVGAGVDRSWVGRKVIIDPSLGWGGSERAQDSSTFRILGLPDDGTFAEMVRIPATNLYASPPNLSDCEAAALPLAGLTAFRAVTSRGGLGAGEKMLVTGIGGGTAVFALQFGSALGAEVYVTSGSQEKIEAAKRIGARGGAVYHEPDWDAQLKEQAGSFDLIVDSAGGEGFSKLIDLASPGGRIVFFGATAGDPPGINSRKIFWKQLSLLGTTMGSSADFQGMVDLVNRFSIRPLVDSVRPLENVNDALDLMARHGQLGKIVLQIG